MVIALGRNDRGRPVLVIGLEEENLRRLRKGLPILRDMAEIGAEHLGELIIVWGDTAADIKKQLRPALGEEARRIVESRPS